MEKRLAKIDKVYAGYCGYDDAEMGFQLSFKGDGWGIGGWSKCAWPGEPSEHAKWTVEDQTKAWGEAVREMSILLKQAKVRQFTDLVGIPVEVTTENNVFKSFRILTEVL